MSIAQQAAAWSESPHHAEVLVVLGGRLLIDWLLKTAARDETSPEQGQAEQALLRLLQSGESGLEQSLQGSKVEPEISLLKYLRRFRCALLQGALEHSLRTKTCSRACMSTLR